MHKLGLGQQFSSLPQPQTERLWLDRNENRYGPAPECVDLLREVGPELLYGYSRDFKEGFYSGLSRRLADRHGVDEKHIVLGYGCEDILKQAVHHFLGAGDRCLVPSASWWYYQALADEVGGVTAEYPIVESDTSFEYDIEALKRVQTENPAKLLLISSPNNPTGNIFPTERLPEVLEHFCQAVVVFDEAYFGLGDQPQEDLAALTKAHPNLLILRSFSKLYGLAGVRIGYGIAAAQLTSFLTFSARYLGYNRISERLALAALDNPRYYEDLRQRVVHERRRFHKKLSMFEEVQVYRSHTNFVLVRFPERIVPALKMELEKRGLFVKFLTDPPFLGCARVSLGTEGENSRVLMALETLLSDLLGR